MIYAPMLASVGNVFMNVPAGKVLYDTNGIIPYRKSEKLQTL